MATVSISLSEELRKQDTAKLVAEMEAALSKTYKSPVRVNVDSIKMGQPKASIIMTDFGYIEPLDAEDLMGEAHEMVAVYFDLSDNEVGVTLNGTLVLKF